MELEHRAASPVGGEVRVTASSSYADGRLHRFSVRAVDASGKVVGTAEITRLVVDVERFLSRL